MNLTNTKLIASLSLAGLLGGCASVMPTQLIDARRAYNTSNAGLAGRLSPTDLYDAKKSLDRADGEFQSNGDTTAVRDYSYITVRKVALADAKARTEQDRQAIAAAMKQGIVVRDGQVQTGQAALANSREQLAEERNANDVTTSALRATNTAQGKELQKATVQIAQERNANDATNSALRATNSAQGKELEQAAVQVAAEKQARETAEARLAGAMKDLATIASVKDEARGMVITLSGSILFASGKFTLLETAKTKLDQVAEALKAQSDDRKMVVEGHTDSQGSVALNEGLSLHRASAVRDYLVSRGVNASRISALGMASRRPLVDNGNAENRANNRRVEIVIQPAQMSAR